MNAKPTYAEKKEMARQEAIDWQYGLDDNNYSLQEIIFFAQHFEKLGKRYGLLKEFRASGIC